MLLDEPFSALDTALRAATRKAVADLLSAAGITTILVTHDQTEALSFADQVAVMGQGRLLQVGAPRDLYLRPKDRLIAEFLGQAIVLPARLAGGWAQCDLGRIAVDAQHGHGEAQIMLRPEQISLEQVADQAAAHADGVLGEVTEVDFGGSVCTVAVRLLNLNGTSLSHGANGRTSLLFQKPSSGLLAIGAVVRIRVVGAAHVFDRPVEAVA
jgi:iron(III) transport system ATP-binding protein